MKTLIIYYSNSGITGLISQILSHELNADIVKIEDLKPRNGFKNSIFGSFDAFRENKTEIYPKKLDLNQYDTIYFGTPVWAGKPTPAIITIIDRCDLKGKDIVLFATMSKIGGQETVERLNEKVKARGGRVIETFTIKTKDKSQEQLIDITENLIEILDLKIYK